MNALILFLTKMVHFTEVFVFSTGLPFVSDDPQRSPACVNLRPATPDTRRVAGRRTHAISVVSGRAQLKRRITCNFHHLRTGDFDFCV